ncbi:MAG: DUF2924 domain-containing protein [Sandarakinorhabdus sp.]|nr:DUF2924 domain-containing protein [Sandarakinorhabdus sp.]
MSRLDETLAALATMTPAQLRDEWERVHKATAPRISPDLLARGIAWQLQERSLRGLAPSAARELKRLAAASAANADAANKSIANNDGLNTGEVAAGPQNRSPTRASAPALPITNAADLRPGTTLMRSWGDRSWSVLVTETGLVFEGRHYDSLSKIAREITGAHWSGPRFFGLRAASVARDKDRAKVRAYDVRAGKVGARTKTAPCIAAGTPSHA